jgi:hypothetical protein
VRLVGVRTELGSSLGHRLATFARAVDECFSCDEPWVLLWAGVALDSSRAVLSGLR